MQLGAHRHNGNRPYGAGLNECHAIAYSTQWSRLATIYCSMLSRPVGSCFCYKFVFMNFPSYVYFRTAHNAVAFMLNKRLLN